jgi:hypothetical protein
MNLIQGKISKTGRHIAHVLLIGCGLDALFILLFAAGIGVLLFADGTAVSSLQEAFGVLSPMGGVEIPAVPDLVFLFLFAIAQLVILFFILYVLYRIFSDISLTYTPFQEKQVARIKQVALLTSAMCIVSSALDMLGNVLLYGKPALKINVVWFMLAAVIYCMAYIFDYGRQLQKQSDETL